MSSGTTMRHVRINDQAWTEADFCRVHRNANSPNEPWSMSEFIRLAVVEKIRKMKRSREWRASRRRRFDLARENKTAIENEIAELVGVADDTADA